MSPEAIIQLISQFLPMLLQVAQAIIQAIDPAHPAAAHLQEAIQAMAVANNHIRTAQTAMQSQP